MQRSCLSVVSVKPKCLRVDGFERCFRRSFSLSSSLRWVRPPWSPEESRRLLELFHKGISAPQIAKEFGHRNLLSIKNKLRALRDGSLKPSSRAPWTAEEDSILLAERQAGYAFKDIYIPGRSHVAMQKRWSLCLDAKRVKTAASRSRRKVTDADVERIIDLRINERKSMRDIAVMMERSERSITYTWYLRCKHLVPEEVLKGLRPSSGWTAKDDDLLIKLYNEGRKMSDINAHFPNKTVRATEKRIYALRNSLLIRQEHASPAVMESLKQELKPYMGASLSRADGRRIREKFPMFSSSAIHATLYRMRNGKAEPKRLPIDRVEAEESTASRRSR